MTFYPPNISEKIESARCVGNSSDANAVGTGASFECGTFVKFSLRVEIETKRIVEARFKTSGCGFTIAAAQVLCEQITDKRLNELHALDKSLLEIEIGSELEKFPENRAHCLEICLDALQSAFKNFRQTQIEEFVGETALICTCFGVSEDAIENLIELNRIETVEAVTDACGAGGGCGSCQPLIEDIIDAVRRERI